MAQGIQVAAAGADAKVGVGRVVQRQPRHAAAGGIDGEHRRAALMIGAGVQMLAIGAPSEGCGTTVPIRSNTAGFASVQRYAEQLPARRLARRTLALRHDRQSRALRVQTKEWVVPSGQVEQHPARAAQGIDDHQLALLIATGPGGQPVAHQQAAVSAQFEAGVAQRLAGVVGQPVEFEPGRRRAGAVAVDDRLGPVQARLFRAQVGVPEAHRVTLVEDGVDLAVLAQRAQAFFVLRVLRRRQRLRHQHQGAALARDAQAEQPALAAQPLLRLAAGGRQVPERGVGVILLAFQRRSRGTEQQVAIGQNPRPQL